MPHTCLLYDNKQNPYRITNLQDETEAETKEEKEEEMREEVTEDGDGVVRKTRAARNAKLRRLCQRRKNGSLAVPTWLRDLWKAGNHSALSLQYEEAGYNKDRTLHGPDASESVDVSGQTRG